MNRKQCIQSMKCGSDPSFKNGNNYYCTKGEEWCTQENICKTMANSGYPFYFYNARRKPYRTFEKGGEFPDHVVVHKPNDPIIEHRESEDPNGVNPASGDCGSFAAWMQHRTCPFPNCQDGQAYSKDKIDEWNKILENAITCDDVQQTSNEAGVQPDNSIEIRQPFKWGGAAWCINPKKAPLIPKECHKYKFEPLCYVDPTIGATDANIGKCSLVPDAFLPPQPGPKGGLRWTCLPDLSHCDCSNEECVKNHPFIFNENTCKPGTFPPRKCPDKCASGIQCIDGQLCPDGSRCPSSNGCPFQCCP